MGNYEFIVWHEGYLDLCPDRQLDAKRLRILRNHLNLVRELEGQLGPVNSESYDLISGPNRPRDAAGRHADSLEEQCKRAPRRNISREVQPRLSRLNPRMT